MKRFLTTATVLALALGGAGLAQAADSAQSGMQHDQATTAGTVRQVQTELKRQGFYKGAIDGEMGPQTKSAIKEFQQKQGLMESAELDPQTLDRLQGGGSAGTSQPPAASQPANPSAPSGNGTLEPSGTPNPNNAGAKGGGLQGQ
jgi:peptidoglycan hydrolase-like protein with peptidoglycan-binding domain